MIKNKYLRIALVALAILFAFGALSSLFPDRTSTKSTTKKPTSNGSTNNNTPIVYNVDSIDDLPETAVEGSIAVVNNGNSKQFGTWKLNDEIDPDSFSTFNGKLCNFTFNNTSYIGISRGDTGPGVDTLSFINEQNGTIAIYYFENTYNFTIGYNVDSDLLLTVPFQDSYDPTFFEYLEKFAVLESPITTTTYYRFENNEWVYFFEES